MNKLGVYVLVSFIVATCWSLLAWWMTLSTLWVVVFAAVFSGVMMFLCVCGCSDVRTE